MIRRCNITPPFINQPGDTYVVVGDTMQQVRGGVVIDTRTITWTVLTAMAHVGGNEITEIFEEVKMPGVMATLVRRVVDQDGTNRFQFSDGTELEFGSRAAALSAVEYLDTEVTTARELLILQSLRKDQGGTNIDCMDGRSCGIDCSAQMPIVQSIGLSLE